ncbi:hypothetical protein CDD83_4269 [Cordyceps sp. RAO-2017]|nr:hypothetical protein CDD83_4269 [Cordyceps sp. RAO-2017]
MASSCIVPTKKQVEDVVRGTNFGDLKQAWIDDIVDLVQSKLSSSSDSTDVSESPTPSDGPSTPSSDFSDRSEWLANPKPFQATVEDDDCCSIKESNAPSVVESDRPCSNTSRRRPPYLTPSHSYPQPSSSTYPKDTSAVKAPSPASSHGNPSLQKAKPPPPPVSSAPSSPKLRPTVHFSERPAPRLHHRAPARSEASDKSSAGPELSIVDLQWGRLFTGYGEPTTRLRQVLRGLADYINAEYEPKNSLVITPGKLHTFYKKCQLDVELYPFQTD